MRKIEEAPNSEILVRITAAGIEIIPALNPDGSRATAPDGFIWVPAHTKTWSGEV